MGAHGAVDQQLQQVGAQHIPVVVVVLLAFVAGHHQAANSFVRQQCLVNRQVGEIGLDRGPLLRVQRLAGLDFVERRRRVTRVIGERVRRQTRWQVVTHDLHITQPSSYRASRFDPPRGYPRPAAWPTGIDVEADKIGI